MPNAIAKSKYGADKISLWGTGALQFVICLLELMQANNYDFLFSSDLSRMLDQSSLFFKKNSVMVPGESAKRVVGIALGGIDKLILMNQSQQITYTVRQSIRSAWPYGIQKDEAHGSFHKFKLNGTPWYSEQGQSVGCRKLLLEIITQMAGIGFKLHANVNLVSFKIIIKNA